MENVAVPAKNDKVVGLKIKATVLRRHRNTRHGNLDAISILSEATCAFEH